MRRCSMVDATVAKASTCRECQVRVVRCGTTGSRYRRAHMPVGVAAAICGHMPLAARPYCVYYGIRRAPPRAFPPAQHIHAHPPAPHKTTSPKKSHLQSSTPHTHTHTDTHTRTPLHYISHPTCLYIPYFELATSRQPDEQSPPTGPRTHFATHSVGAPP